MYYTVHNNISIDALQQMNGVNMRDRIKEVLINEMIRYMGIYNGYIESIMKERLPSGELGIKSSLTICALNETDISNILSYVPDYYKDTVINIIKNGNENKTINND